MNTPNSDIDILSRDVAIIKQELIKFNQRLNDADSVILSILRNLKKGEEAFELRVARTLYNSFNGIAHNLEHAIEDFQNKIIQKRYGFEVEVVDGISVKLNEHSILVKKTKDGYNYATANKPGIINNQGCEVFSKYFDENPEVFGEKEQIIVNITKEKANHDQS